MVISDELQQKYGFLLHPIKDLTKNWDIDVAHVLEDYLGELEKMTFSFDNGKTVLNFAEASLLIQGTACVWSRKVEYLHILVKQTLDMIVSKRNITEQNSELAAGEKTGEVNFDDEDDKLLKLDDVTITSRRELTRSYDPVAPIPIAPTAMLENDTDNRGRAIFTSNKNDTVCHTNDFWENHFVPLNREVAVLDRDSGGVLDDIVSSFDELGGVSADTFCEVEDQMDPPEPNVDDVTNDIAGCDQVDDADEGGCESDDNQMGDPVTEPEIGDAFERRMRLRVRGGDRLADLSEKEELVKILDPHEHYTDPMWQLKKYKKTRSFKIPDYAKENLRKRKLDGTSLEKIPAISVFLSAKDIQRNKPVKTEHRNLRWLFDAEQKIISHVWKDIRKLATSQNTQGLPGKEAGNDCVFEDHDISGGCHDFSRQSDTISPDLDDLIGDVAETQGHGADFEACPPNDGPERYEDLVRHHVEMFYNAARRYKEETALSQRVKLWDEAITPRLAEQDTRPEFDIHKYGDIVLGKFANPQDSHYFKDVVDSSEAWYISRLFAATLQLVNDNNFAISKHDDFSQSVNTMKLTLLSHHKLRERLDDYNQQT